MHIIYSVIKLDLSQSPAIRTFCFFKQAKLRQNNINDQSPHYNLWTPLSTDFSVIPTTTRKYKQSARFVNNFDWATAIERMFSLHIDFIFIYIFLEPNACHNIILFIYLYFCNGRKIETGNKLDKIGLVFRLNLVQKLLRKRKENDLSRNESKIYFFQRNFNKTVFHAQHLRSGSKNLS